MSNGKTFATPKNIDELIKQYDLNKEKDLYSPNGKNMAIRKPAIMKIIQMRGFKFGEPRYEAADSLLGGVCIVKEITTNTIDVGEANPENCTFPYRLTMAYNRAVSRCVTQIIGAQSIGIYGEIEFEHQSDRTKAQANEKINLDIQKQELSFSDFTAKEISGVEITDPSSTEDAVTKIKLMANVIGFKGSELDEQMKKLESAQEHQVNEIFSNMRNVYMNYKKKGNNE